MNIHVRTSMYIPKKFSYKCIRNENPTTYIFTEA